MIDAMDMTSSLLTSTSSNFNRFAIFLTYLFVTEMPIFISSIDLTLVKSNLKSDQSVSAP